MTSYLRPYRRFDMGKITPRADFAGLSADFEGEPDAAATWTLVDDRAFDAQSGRTDGPYAAVKACGGYIRERAGLYGLWGFCAGDLTRRDWVMIARQTREIIAGLFAGDARRVHALACVNHAGAVKFLLHLGLKNDMNRLTDYGPDGEDYVLLAALRRFYR